eukprot:TRINITY_DN472_c0_g1_i1.p1 TRINITY_DN472_c0_g1~~TRINITY_DN472_c0_g1_i1.p1  ORF type:complete len:432 (+),score=150.04 TRINITY_DN472_c0_g1_i1:115-1296(+)
MKRKGEHKVEQVPKKKKPEEEEEESEESSEEEVQTTGKKAGKVAQKATPKKEEKSKKAEQTKKTEKKDEKKKPSKQEKKKVTKKESSDEEEDDEESEEETKTAKATKPKPAAKAQENKGGKKAAKKESDDESEEEEEEEPKNKSKNDKNKKDNKSKKDEDEEEEEDEDEDEEEEKPQPKKESKPAEADGFVVKSAANGGMKIKGAPPPPVNLDTVKTTTLFIKNLPWSVTDDLMKELFADCGPIREIRWVNDKDTGKFKGFGFIDFETPEALKKAMTKDGADCLGRPIKLDISTPKSSGGAGGGNFKPRPKIEGSHTVFIGKCPDSIEDDDIRQLFQSCGTVSSIRWVTDKMSGKFKGCGFVVFEDTSSTDKAVALSGSTVKGSSLRIDYADD